MKLRFDRDFKTLGFGVDSGVLVGWGFETSEVRRGVSVNLGFWNWRSD